MKKRKRKKRYVIVSILIVFCTMINVMYYSLKHSEAYGMAVVGGTLAYEVGGAVLSGLLALGLLGAGIYQETATQEEIEEMTQAEQEAYHEEVYINQREVYQLLLDGGYFDGTDIEGLVEAALEDELDESSNVLIDFQEYVKKKNAEDEVNYLGGGNNSGDDTNVIASLGVSSDFMKIVSEELKEVFGKFIKANQPEIDTESFYVEFPASMPEDYRNLTNYTGYTVTQSQDGNIYFTSYGVHSFYRYNDYMGHSGYCIEAVRYRRYKIFQGEWVVDCQHEVSSGQSSANVTWLNEVKRMFFTDIDFGSIYDFPVTPYNGGPWSTNMDMDELQDKINAYMENIGLNSRYSAQFAEQNNIFDNVDAPLDPDDEESPKTDKIIITPDPVKTTQQYTVPISQVVSMPGTSEKLQPQIDAAVNAAVSNAAAGSGLTKNDKNELSKEPYSPNLGPYQNYTVDGLEDVFPFCIPFDIFRCVQVMSADAEAPYIEYPFVWESLGIHETIVLDMAQFENAAAICRWVEVLIFIYGLASKTKAVISW